jgi:hypothetical protein
MDKKNTLEEHEQGLEFVSFQAENQNPRRERDARIVKSSRAVKRFLTAPARYL